jgi:DNA (cytosine-5)-methyltransferase 1
MKNKKLTVIDLFSGCGGLSKGFLDAGYDILLGVDHDKDSLKTFKLNHKDSKVLELDLFDKSNIKEIKKALMGVSPDVIVGGPPCQGFSLTGTRNFDDKRNQLYLSMIETVKELKPRAFLIENVPGIARLYEGAIKNEIISRFTKLGYTVSMQILTAADYGVPQIRKRLVFIGLKNEKFSFPEPMLKPENYVTTSEAIGDLPSRKNEFGKEEDSYSKEPISIFQKKMRGRQNTLFNHVASNHTDLVKSIISQVPEGGNHKDLPTGVGSNRHFNEAWTRYHSQKPSRTIDTGHRNHFHYEYDRVPTVRENARLQSFPDNFIFVGTRTSQNRQVGNAVPPLMGFAIAKHLLKYLKHEKKTKNN